MQTFNRICIKDFVIEEDGEIFKLERGKEYLTSAEGYAPAIVCPEFAEIGHVVVFSKYWVKVPINIFAGAMEFTSA